MFRMFFKVPVISCCVTVDSCHKTLMSGLRKSLCFNDVKKRLLYRPRYEHNFLKKKIYF